MKPRVGKGNIFTFVILIGVIFFGQRVYDRFDSYRNSTKLEKFEGVKNLPEGMNPDRDNVVYYDTEKDQFYINKWEDGRNRDIPTRYYIHKK